MGRNSEDALLAEASNAIGGGPEIIAAGVFTLEDMIGVAAVGASIGGFVGGELTSGLLGSAAGSGLGMAAAKKEYAESHGMTVELIVAVTADTIYVINRDTGGRLPGVVMTFDRVTCEITIKNLGPSRFFHLVDPTRGHEIKLGGTRISKPDRLVMELLTS
jgi:hypothetical protein